MQREAVSGVSLDKASVVEVSLDLVQQVAERIDVVKAACPSALPSCLKPDVEGLRQLLRFIYWYDRLRRQVTLVSDEKLVGSNC